MKKPDGKPAQDEKSAAQARAELTEDSLEEDELLKDLSRKDINTPSQARKSIAASSKSGANQGLSNLNKQAFVSQQDGDQDGEQDVEQDVEQDGEYG